ncbi:MAG: hypothetical protein ABWX76_04550 [Leifsonia flava]
MRVPSPAAQGAPSQRRPLRALGLGATVFALVAGGAVVATPAYADPTNPDFGPNVTIFDPSTPVDEINATLASFANEAEFSTNRHAAFFKPGTYGSAAGENDPATATGIVNAEVGYYTSISGLGASPEDVRINGALHVEPVRACEPNPWDCQSPGSLTRFWRSLSNMSINPIQRPLGVDAERPFPSGVTDPHQMRWAVSQAAPLRRMNIEGSLTLFGRVGEYASGGYMANSAVSGTVVNGSQQQWFTRDSSVGTWEGGVWNVTSVGVEGAHAATPAGEGDAATPLYTTVAETPVTRESPFLYLDGDEYKVFVPKAKTNSSGVDWSTDAASGDALSIADFYIAKTGDTAAQINAALAEGKNLLVTPGVYTLSEAITVTRADTVVLGLGLATLVPTNGNAAIDIADVTGVKVAGLTVDAGEVNSPVLVKVGPTDASASDPADPTTLSDVFVRVGGAHVGRATTSIEVNSDDVLLDHIWAWRADHGDGVAWDSNTGDHGVVVNGDDVTALGLFVEHYQKAQTVWNGNGGTTLFYQSELPYDPPSQAAWSDGDRLGYASYQVAPGVTSHSASGLGIYSFFNQNVDIRVESGIQAPKSAGVRFTNMVSVFLNGSGGINHIINDTGLPAVGSFASPGLLSYPPADTQAPTVAITAAPAAPDGSNGWYRSGVSLTVTGSDDFTPLTLEANVDGAGWTPVTGPIALAEGTHSVQARATDGSNNVSAVASWTGKVDGVAPVATVAFDATSRKASVTAADGTGSGVSGIEYRLGSGAWQAYTAPVSVGDAATTFGYRATDAAGNRSTDGSLSVPAKVAGKVPLAVAAASLCINGKVSVAVYALNIGKAKADIRLTTQWADAKFTGVGFGKAVYKLFPTGVKSVPKGTATVAGYTWVNGAGSYSTYTPGYAALNCGRR